MGWVHNPTNGRVGLGEGWREEREREREMPLDRLKPVAQCIMTYRGMPRFR